jgi:hypothetical protein
MRDMMFDGETLQVTLCGTNLPQNAASSCHHPVRTDDGATAYVVVHMYWYISQYSTATLKNKYAVPLKINALNVCIFITYSSDH